MANTVRHDSSVTAWVWEDAIQQVSMDEGVAKQEGGDFLVIWDAVQRMWAGVVLARASQDIRSPLVRASQGVEDLM